MRLPVRLALSVALVLSAAAPARASLITWTLDGFVTESPATSPLATVLPVGTFVEFTVTLDTTAIDQCLVPGAGFYTASSGSALVDGISYTSEFTAIEVNNAAGNCIGGDASGITMRFVGFDGPFLAASIGWDSGPGEALPAVPPETALLLFGYACVICGDATGAIASSQVLPPSVPEPALLTLVLAGAAALGVRRRFRHRPRHG